MLDGLVPVDYVGHCGEKLLSGGRLVIQGHLGPNVAEAAVFRKLELDRKLVDHRVFRLGSGRSSGRVNPGGRDLLQQTPKACAKIIIASHPGRRKSATRKRAQATVKRHVVNVDATF